MRQLNDKEMEQISGSLVTNATEAGALLGAGIGKLLDLNVTGAITGIGNGVVSIVDNGSSAIKQLFGNK
ncbi:hypothetical protein [Pantoea alhagi]|nr:hypothetical protein [Pantoea alhagi]